MLIVGITALTVKQQDRLISVISANHICDSYMEKLNIGWCEKAGRFWHAGDDRYKKASHRCEPYFYWWPELELNQ